MIKAIDHIKSNWRQTNSDLLKIMMMKLQLDREDGSHVNMDKKAKCTDYSSESQIEWLIFILFILKYTSFFVIHYVLMRT